MADQNAIDIRIGANVTALRSATREATGHVDSLVGKLREFKSEQVSQLRSARFFANELAEIGVGADGAKSALRDLIAVGLSGGGIVTAFEASLFVLKQLHEHFKDNEEAAKKLKETSEKLDDALQKIRDSFGPPKSETQKAWLAWLRPIEKEMDALQKKIDDIMEAGKLIPEIGASAEAVAGAGPGKKKAGLEGAVAKGKKERDATEKAEARDKANKEAEEDHLKFLDRQDNAEVDAAAHFQKVWKEAYDKKTKDAEDGLKNILDAEIDHIRKVHEAEVSAQQALDKFFNEKQKKKIEQDKKEQEAEAKADDERQKRIEQLAHVIDHSLSTALRSVLSGTKDVGEALLGMFEDLALAAADALLKVLATGIATAIIGEKVDSARAVLEVVHNAAVGGAAAAASLAAIPVIGPALAIEGGLAMQQAILATFGPPASAAGGLDRVPVPLLPTFLHADEMVLSAKYANPLRDMLEERGARRGGDRDGGGGEVRVHIQAWDGGDVMRVVSSDAFRRAMREARRNGLT